MFSINEVMTAVEEVVGGDYYALLIQLEAEAPDWKFDVAKARKQAKIRVGLSALNAVSKALAKLTLRSVRVETWT